MNRLNGTRQQGATLGDTIGFIGLGTMGGPMCARLAGTGASVVAFDIDPERVAALEGHGVQPSPTAAECAAAADVLLTSLPRPDHVEAVMRDAGALGSLRPGSLWIDLTTNRRDLVVQLSEEAPDGVSVVDSPVTGAVDGARLGRLTLFAGGADRDLERAEPILDRLGLVIRCGSLGNGNVVKLVTNQLWFVAAAALGEAFAVGLCHGVDLAVLHRAICNSVGDSFVARHDAPSIFAGHYDPSFSLGLCLKDLALVAELAAALDGPLLVTDAAHAAFRDAGQRYGTAAGEMHVAKRIEDDNRLSFRLPGDWTPPWEVAE